MEGEKSVDSVLVLTRDPTRRVLTILKPSSEVRSRLFPPLDLIMSSVDAPNSSLALGSSAISALPRAHVQKNVQAEEIELSETNARLTVPELQKRSVVEVDVSERSKSFTLRARIQFLSLCWTFFLMGWSDSSTGPLLPRIQSTYHVLCSLSV
jgi:hypothetical protein